MINVRMGSKWLVTDSDDPDYLAICILSQVLPNEYVMVVIDCVYRNTIGNRWSELVKIDHSNDHPMLHITDNQWNDLTSKRYCYTWEALSDNEFSLMKSLKRKTIGLEA
jgi:hypothetical protein